MAKEIIKTRRDFPAVETLLQSPELAEHLTMLPRPISAAIVKQVIADQKKKFDSKTQSLTHTGLLAEINHRLLGQLRAQTTGVINATGIVIHTNLGRAPLSEQIMSGVFKSATGYANVEFDLSSGKRGGRGAACEAYLAELTGAEAATVVNNNAAAMFLILNTLASRRKVLISRGELVQIGGGFRIPDILRRSGARLSEIGSTNITTLDDYQNGVDDKTGLILKVHKSNFIQAGFTEEVDIKQLVQLGRKHSIPVVHDHGSGVLVPTGKLLGYREPTVQESVRAGADLTCFSGDKMMGGIQSGLIVGRQELISRLKKNPIYRTVRVDKIVFAALERILASYLDGTHTVEIKLWHLLGRSIAELKEMAETVLKKAGKPSGVSIEKTSAFIGGGAMPEKALPSIGLVFSPDYKAKRLMDHFRDFIASPIVGRINEDCFILDLKAVESSQLAAIARAIRQIPQ